MLRNDCRAVLPLDDEVIIVRLHPIEEKYVLRQIGVLYDMLSDAVGEINSVFSVEVGYIIIMIQTKTH